MKSNLRKYGLQFVIAMLFLTSMLITAVQPVQAARIINDGQIGAGEVIDDDVLTGANNIRMDGTINGLLIATGDTITVNGTVNGDVFATGNKIIIASSARIDGNLIAAGAEITVAGQVTGSIAAASASIALQNGAKVGRNIYYAGYGLENASGTALDRSLYAAVYQAILNGDVRQDVQVAAGAVELNGSVGRDMIVDMGVVEKERPDLTPLKSIPNMQVNFPPAIAPGLRISNNAKIGGQLTYTSSESFTSAIQSQPSGGVVYRTPVPQEVKPAERRVVVTSPVVKWLGDNFRRLITLLILGALAMWLMPNLLKRTAAFAGQKPLPAAGYGFLALLAGFAGAGVVLVALIFLTIFLAVITLGSLSGAFFSLGSSGLTVAFTIFMLLVLYGSKLTLAYFVGDRILGAHATETRGRAFLALLIGLLLFVLIRAIPILGWLFDVLVTLVGLGAMWLLYDEWRKSRLPSQPAPAETLPA